jgi:flagellar hook-basal body complex protein FliE
MAGTILPVSPVSPIDLAARAGSNVRSPASGFQDVFAAAIQDVEKVNNQATAAVERFLNGDGEDLHTTALATQKAEMAFDLFLQARNKVTAAYQEIMRMPM